MKTLVRSVIALGLMLCIAPFTSLAHVKWFADWSFQDSPASVGDILTPLFFGLTLLTVAGLAVAVLLV